MHHACVVTSGAWSHAPGCQEQPIRQLLRGSRSAGGLRCIVDTGHAVLEGHVAFGGQAEARTEYIDDCLSLGEESVDDRGTTGNEGRLDPI